MTEAAQRRVVQAGRKTGLRPTGKVLPQHQRAHNRSMVLQRLFHDGPTSRADLSRATGLTRVTVSDLVSSLLEDSLVEELGTTRGSVGKPATLVGMRTEAFSIVALDLSDDAVIRGSVMSLSGLEVISRQFPAAGVVGEAFVALIDQSAAALIAAAPQPVLGVGIGAPGVIDPDGRVVEAPNRNFYDVPLAARLTESLGLPVLVANDADVAALGEYAYAGASDCSLLLTIGQGVGAGLMLDGARVHGANGAAGEIGHVTVTDGGEPCACGRHGCLETILSKPALDRSTEGLDPLGVERHLEEVGRLLGRTLAPIVAALNLSEVLLSGPAEYVGGALKEAASQEIARRVMPATGSGFTVRTAGLGDRSVLSGAAGLVLDAQLGIS